MPHFLILIENISLRCQALFANIGLGECQGLLNHLQVNGNRVSARVREIRNSIFCSNT